MAAIGARRPARSSILPAGFGLAFGYIAAVVVLVVIGLALKAAFVQQFAQVQR
jgi:hypothetical protein